MTWSGPKTWNVGDPGISADLNTFIRDNTSWLYGDTAWTAPTLINSWANSSPYPFPSGFRRFGNVVRLRGSITGGSSNSTAFVLPSSYWPPYTCQMPMVMNGTTYCGLIQVASNGAVVPAFSSGSYVSLDGVEFPLV